MLYLVVDEVTTGQINVQINGSRINVKHGQCFCVEGFLLLSLFYEWNKLKVLWIAK